MIVICMDVAKHLEDRLYGVGLELLRFTSFRCGLQRRPLPTDRAAALSRQFAGSRLVVRNAICLPNWPTPRTRE